MYYVSRGTLNSTNSTQLDSNTICGNLQFLWSEYTRICNLLVAIVLFCCCKLCSLQLHRVYVDSVHHIMNVLLVDIVIIVVYIYILLYYASDVICAISFAVHSLPFLQIDFAVMHQ